MIKNKLLMKIKRLVAMVCIVGMVMPSMAYAEGTGETAVGENGRNAATESMADGVNVAESEMKTNSSTEIGNDIATGNNTDAESGTKVENSFQSNIETERGTETESDMESVSEPESESETETESETESEPETELRENSWRFENGQWLGAYAISTYALDGLTPWTNVDGNYINSNGDVIQGAIARGIDVSEWQGKIDWDKVANDDVSFAIIRSGAGQTYNDKYWETNTEACERLGIPYGTYIYSYAQSPEDAVKEAEHVLSLVAGKDLDYPIYFDMEDSSDPSADSPRGSLLHEVLEDGTLRQRTSAELAAIAKAFCDKVTAAGYEVQIYANQYWWDNYLTDDYFSQFTNRWVAQYNSTCTYTGGYAMWQCTSSGRIDGINGNVDIDMLYTDQYDQRFAVKGFVTRLYELVLGRKPDPVGLNEWVSVLIDQRDDGAGVARDFIYSTEFTEKNVSDEEYIEILYNTCLNRKPDEAGLQAWLDRFADGFSRKYVLRGFIQSVEFTEICQRYGIERGSIEVTEYRDMNDGITKYVTRCYNMFLGRKPDVKGLNDWTKIILEDKDNAKTLPEGFIFSTEFLEKNASDEEFVKICYRAILDREADHNGLNAWVRQLQKGQSRKDVLAGFTNSVEFKELLAKYGL